MSIRVRFAAETAMNLKVEIERLSDGKGFDFSDNTFKVSPTTPGTSMTEVSGRPGRYKKDVTTTGAQWPDGDYAIYIIDTDASNATVFASYATISDNDDATILPATLAEIHDSELTESYPVVGDPVTLAQAVYAILQRLTHGTFAANRIHIKDRSGESAYTLIVDDPDNPTYYMVES